jgi:thioesterase domain-containing protein/acyl carrier protein
MQASEHAGTTVLEPRTYHEDVIRNLFADALALAAERISIDVSFFELGGRSLHAERLEVRIGTTFNIELPPALILEQETIERLGQLAEELTKRPPQGKPLGLRPTGKGLPLFCIHPSSGFGRPYRVLLRHLSSEIPVYALEARGINDGDILPATLNDMCADYIRQIQQIQPNGPYSLLGWSFGAIPAHAIATGMQARGLEVASLIIIDGFPFDGEPWLEGLVASHRSHWAKEILSYRDLQGASDERITTMVDRLCAIKRNNVHLQAYEDPSVFMGDMLLIKCMPSGHGAPNPFSWNRYVSGKVLDLMVPFGHNVLLTPEAAAAYGPHIAGYLARTIGGNE